MSRDIRAESLQSPIDLVEYLYRRLRQIGIKSVHGVPGDYNLVALDSLEKCDLDWVGSVNELNAGYACDGYARINGMGAMITTFGVGELSALNAIAGSYSEYVPVVHIVGTPSTISQANGMLLHHTCMGNGDFNVFANMSQNISCISAHLNDPMDAAQLVDHAIRECYIKSRPAYITLPTDMVGKKVEGKRLEKPLDLRYPDNDPAQEDYAVENIMKHLQVAKKPIILVDACAIRHRAMDETQKLVEQSGLPTFVTPMGKGAINETLPNYSGVYAGNGSHQDVQDMVESSDLILSIGAIKSDFNTAGFTYHTSQLSSIDFHSSYVQVKYSEYHGLRMNGVLNKITQKLSTFKLSVQPSLKPTNEVDPKEDKSQDTTITHSWLWPKFGQWVRDDDVIVTETGTSGYGIWEVKFKRGVRAISQILWGSIGYATGAAQGAALAAQEQKKGRTILFTGDGSFQLTAQELSTMIRKRLNPIVFIICNDGFTIERFIHGMDATYNDIAAWKYKDLPAVFNAQPGEYKTYQVKTKSDMQKLLSDEDFATSKCLRLVELYMRKDDAPKALVMTAEASAKNNARLD